MGGAEGGEGKRKGEGARDPDREPNPYTDRMAGPAPARPRAPQACECGNEATRQTAEDVVCAGCGLVRAAVLDDRPPAAREDGEDRRTAEAHDELAFARGAPATRVACGAGGAIVAFLFNRLAAIPPFPDAWTFRDLVQSLFDSEVVAQRAVECYGAYLRTKGRRAASCVEVAAASGSFYARRTLGYPVTIKMVQTIVPRRKHGEVGCVIAKMNKLLGGMRPPIRIDDIVRFYGTQVGLSNAAIAAACKLVDCVAAGVDAPHMPSSIAAGAIYLLLPEPREPSLVADAMNISVSTVLKAAARITRPEGVDSTPSSPFA